MIWKARKATDFVNKPGIQTLSYAMFDWYASTHLSRAEVEKAAERASPTSLSRADIGKAICIHGKFHERIYELALRDPTMKFAVGLIEESRSVRVDRGLENSVVKKFNAEIFLLFGRLFCSWEAYEQKFKTAWSDDLKIRKIIQRIHD